ncbi:MAG: oligoribonuclease [Gammaproteobacteria bacterium]|nr:oligoribonuclease [Gammaproteobacteria bacterium]
MPATLVWMDMEMTGLDPDRDSILEVATLITDDELNVIAEGPVFAIAQPEAVLAGMDDWNQRTHGESGLLARVRTEGVSMVEAEQRTLAFIKAHVAEKTAPLCGNTVWQDRRFLYRYMPVLEAWLHYRIIDVSTLKELARRWRPDVATGFKKQGNHTALADIRESLEELKHYRSTFLRTS